MEDTFEFSACQINTLFQAAICFLVLREAARVFGQDQGQAAFLKEMSPETWSERKMSPKYVVGALIIPSRTEIKSLSYEH